MFDEIKELLLAALAGLATLVMWFSRRDMSRYDRGLERIETLEKNSVTYEELDKALERLSDERREELDRVRTERREMHSENKEILLSISQKIDRNEERDANTRHDIRDKVQVATSQLATIDKRLDSVDRRIDRVEHNINELRNGDRPDDDEPPRPRNRK